MNTFTLKRRKQKQHWILAAVYRCGWCTAWNW